MEEVSRSDLLLHLVDMSNPRHEEQIDVIEKVLNEIGAGEIPTVLVPNKVDVAAGVPVRQLRSEGALDICPISALAGTGVDRLLDAIGAVLDRRKEEFHACFSPAQGELIALLRERGRVVTEIYDGDIIRVTPWSRRTGGQCASSSDETVPATDVIMRLRTWQIDSRSRLYVPVVLDSLPIVLMGRCWSSPLRFTDFSMALSRAA